MLNDFSKHENFVILIEVNVVNLHQMNLKC
jgi:hypothetical protein